VCGKKRRDHLWGFPHLEIEAKIKSPKTEIPGNHCGKGPWESLPIKKFGQPGAGTQRFLSAQCLTNILGTEGDGGGTKMRNTTLEQKIYQVEQKKQLIGMGSPVGLKRNL